MIYVIWFDHSSFLMKPFNNDNGHRKRALFTNSNMTKDISVRNYFANRYCIKYGDSRQPFRFDEQPGRIDISGKLRIVVSLDALNSLTNRYKGKTYRNFPLHFLIVS